MTQPFPYLSDDDYAKARWHLRAQINDAMVPLRAYGQGAIVDEVVEVILGAVDDWGQVIRGVDKPIVAKNKRGKW